MVDTKTPGDKKLSVPSKTLSLKPRVETGTVRQSFSHGRSKQVVVEKRGKRRIDGGQEALWRGRTVAICGTRCDGRTGHQRTAVRADHVTTCDHHSATCDDDRAAAGRRAGSCPRGRGRAGRRGGTAPDPSRSRRRY